MSYEFEMPWPPSVNAWKSILNPPTLRRYDIDNFCKSLFDALTLAKFWDDDEQITSLSIKKGTKTKGGSIIIKVYPDKVVF